MRIKSEMVRSAGTVAQTSPMDVMNFLNEVAERYPAAISFASGRPAEQLFALSEWMTWIPEFVAYQAKNRGTDLTETFSLLAQYGRTNGIINDLIARQLSHDHAIECSPDRILVTAGCQEAMELLIKTLCDGPEDVVLVRDPCYIGITGVAVLNKVELAPFDCDHVDEVPRALRAAVARARQQGKRPRAFYVVPDFDNPTGSVLSRQAREEIVTFCGEEGIVVLEDNPYGMFRYEGHDVPTMYALDQYGAVIYLGTYSKTLCPTLRIGFAAVPWALLGKAGAGDAFVNRLSQAKSFGAVNTSQLTQALAGAVLLHEQYSLRRVTSEGVALYRRQRDCMLGQLEHEFADLRGHVVWNHPQGGFFLCVELPFPFGQQEVVDCAEQYGVLVMPLRFFSLGTGQHFRVRLAFSCASERRIAEGVARFAAYVRSRLADV